MSNLVNNSKDFIVDFYSKKNPIQKRKIDFKINRIGNLNQGLGDTLSVFSVLGQQERNIDIYSPSKHFKTLIETNQYYAGSSFYPNDNFIRVEVLQGEYDCGNGHFFQRIQRTCGLKIDLIPKPYINKPEKEVKGYIALCFSVGAHAANQKHIHPRARELYDEHRVTIQNFINDNLDRYYFYEIGTEFTRFENVENKCHLPLKDSIIELSKAEYFIGMHSGVMHLAAGLDIKSIVLLNFPKPEEIVLPVLKDIGTMEVDWLEPQHVYFHMDSGANLVKYFNRENLERAIVGEIYPFWKPEEFSELVSL